MSIASELELLQRDIGRKLESESYFGDIPVFVVRSKTVESDIANALQGVTRKQGKCGIAVQVMMPTADCVAEYEKVPGPFLVVSYIVRVQEIPVINMGAIGTNKPAEEVALHVLNALHLFNFGRSLAEFRASPNALTPSLEFEPRLTYDCEFHSVYQLPHPSRVPTPTAAIADSMLTLDCADPDATIYYATNNDNFPSAGGGGTIYSGPIPVIVGQTVRAAAYRAGYHGSQVLRIDIAE